MMPTNIRCRKLKLWVARAVGMAIWWRERGLGGHRVESTQDSCSQVVVEVSSPGGAVQQPGSHILQPLGHADASGRRCAGHTCNCNDRDR